MLKKDVPQDIGMAEGLTEVCYAVDEDGRYDLVASAGWEPKNIANDQAWEVIGHQLQRQRDAVKAGEVSPLAYHMTKHQMDIALLAKFVGLWAWQVRRHLRPKVFARLSPAVLAKYASLFGLSRSELQDVSTVDDGYRPGKDRLI